ncbi:hypothetical protein D9M69_654180 [compost metagenome]
MQLRIKTVDSIVEIMVSHSGQVILQHAHELELQFASIIVKIRRSLENITGIQKQYVRIFLADAFDQAGSA